MSAARRRFSRWPPAWVVTLDKQVAVLNSLNALYSGHGIVNGKAALATALPAGAQSFASSTGSGTLDASRGGVYVVDKGASLTGQKDIFGRPFDSAAMALGQTRATTWSGGMWNGSRWSGDGWSGSQVEHGRLDRHRLGRDRLVRQSVVGDDLGRLEVVGGGLVGQSLVWRRLGR